MRASITVILILALSAYVSANNPGIVANIQISYIQQVKDYFFPLMVAQMKSVPIPNQSKGPVSSSNGVMTIQNTNPDNVQITLNPSGNSVRLHITNTFVYVSSDWKFDEVVSFSGSSTGHGPISSIWRDIAFATQTKEGYIIPQVNIENFSMVLDTNNFEVEVGSGFEAEVTEAIANFFKKEIVDSIQSQVQAKMNLEISEKLNQRILADYPTSVEIVDGISFSTTYTSKILVSENYIQIPLDATVFRTQNGYSRSSTAAAIPTAIPTVDQDVLAYIGEYFLNTLINTVNTEHFTYTTSILGVSVTIDLPADSTAASFEDGLFSLTVSPQVHFAGSLKFEGTMTMAVDPKITPGGSSDLMSIQLNMSNFEIEKSSLKVFGFDMPFSAIVDAGAFFIKHTANYLIPALVIPKSPEYPFTVTSVVSSISQGFLEGGLSMTF